MDRAEHLKKRLDQEKEGKEAILESVCLSSCDKACFTSVPGCALWSSVWSGLLTLGSLQVSSAFPVFNFF